MPISLNASRFRSASMQVNRLNTSNILVSTLVHVHLPVGPYKKEQNLVITTIFPVHV